jgi:hypothetical protein
VKRLQTYLNLIENNVDSKNKIEEISQEVLSFIKKFDRLDDIQANLVRLHNMEKDEEIHEIIDYLETIEGQTIEKLKKEVTNQDLDQLLKAMEKLIDGIDYNKDIKIVIENIISNKIKKINESIHSGHVDLSSVLEIKDGLNSIRYNLEIYNNLIDDESHLRNLKSVIKNYKFIEDEVDFLNDLTRLKKLLIDEGINEKYINAVEMNIKSQKLNVEMLIHNKLKSLFQVTQAVY